MTRKELNLRILELFPKLAEVEDWEWDETEDDEPVVMVEKRATFTGLADGAVDLTGPIPEHLEDRRLADRAERPLRVEGADGRPDRHGGGRPGFAQTRQPRVPRPRWHRSISPRVVRLV
jgi:hypothetical protein